MKSVTHNADGCSPPNDLGTWQEATRAFAEHFRVAGLRLGCHEVWNEPDFPAASDGYFSGTRDDYLAMYRLAALGLRARNPDSAKANRNRAVL